MIEEVQDNRFVNTYQQQKIIYFMLLKEDAEDTNYIWFADGNGDATLVYYTGNKQVIKVPKMISGHPVKYIAPTCYNNKDFITSIVVHNDIVSIG
jgi:hypothetical protein